MARLTIVLLLLSLLALGVVGWEQRGLRDDLGIFTGGELVGSIEIDWISGGATVHFKSTHLPTETEDAWKVRARAEYLAMREVFPPDAAK